MNDSESAPDQLNELAHEFAERYRRGDRPSLTDYAIKYPALAAEIRELFPAMALIEQFGSVAGPASGPSARTATPDGTTPRQLGEYRILREVARGGMGIVYEAVQESLGRHVALKVLPFQSLANATHRERFRREARAAANLHHTNIVPVFGVGEHDGIHYFAMQFIQGQGLDSVLHEVSRQRRARASQPGEPAASRPGPVQDGEGHDLSASLAGGLLTGRFPGKREDGNNQEPEVGDRVSPVGKPEPEPVSSGSTSEILAGKSGFGAQSDAQYFRSVARIGIQVADALAYAHQQGVLHRDVKPSNLLLDSQGTVWVTDFGLAKSEGTEELTGPGDFVGTLRYTAPERFQGRDDARSDVFSLGLTLYEMVTLRPAFAASGRAQLLERLLREQPRRPRKLDVHVPQDLETLILKAIAKEPGQRYQSANELADDLRRFLADRPVRARRSRWPERYWRWCRRNPAVASLTAFVATLLVTVAAVSLSDAARLRDEQGATQMQLHQTRVAEAEATRRLYRSLVEQARASRLSRRIGQRIKTLEVLGEAAAMARAMNLPDEAFLELRNEVIACLALPDVTVAKEWDGWPAGSLHLDFDGTLEHYARVDRQGVVSIRRVADDTEIHRLPGFGPGNYGSEEARPHFSPDGRLLLLARDQRLRVWDLAGPTPVVVIDEQADVGAFDVSPDSRQLAIGRPDGSIDLVEVSSGRHLRRLGSCPRARDIAFHPGGRQLALSCATGVQIRDLATGDLVTDLPLSDGALQLAWHPNGKSLAAGGADRIIHVWDMGTRTPIARLEGHRGDGVQFSYNRAGDQIASGCWDCVLRLWDVRTGRQLFSTPSNVPALRFSPDDRRLAAGIDGQQKVKLWAVTPACGYRALIPAPMPGKRETCNCTISPKDQLVAIAMSDTIAFWDLPTGGQLTSLPMGNYQCALFEPSGALLTAGKDGLQRWPLRRDSPEPLDIGPPQRLPLPTAVGQIATSRDGLTIASAEYWGALVWRQDRPGPPIKLSPHEDTRAIAVSPDGRWVATGSYFATKVKIWDANTGAFVHELPVEAGSNVSFSPDGRWLATDGGGCRLWSVDSWQLGPQVGVGGHPTFSPDGKILAVETFSGGVRLVNPDTGREYARLEDPDQERARTKAFSPDATRLAMTSYDSLSLHIWDLRAIRTELVRMGLDWDLPSPRQDH
jgi:serine/threonine protein kinase/WD40 repeat protein